MRKYLCFLFLAFFTFTGYAHGLDLKGFQPLAPYGVFSTFSAESLPGGKSGVALGFESSVRPDFYRITGQFVHGFTDSLEIGVTIPYRSEDGGSTQGFEDIAIGLKHRIFEEGKYGPSVAYLITGSFSSGGDEFGTKGSIGGGIIVTKRVGPVKGHLNRCYSRPGASKRKDDVTFAGGLEFSASHAFTILGELYLKKSYSGRVDRLEPRFGYRILMAEDLFTTLGGGFDFKNRSPEYRILLSVSYLFPAQREKIKKINEQEE